MGSIADSLFGQTSRQPAVSREELLAYAPLGWDLDPPTALNLSPFREDGSIDLACP